MSHEPNEVPSAATRIIPILQPLENGTELPSDTKPSKRKPARSSAPAPLVSPDASIPSAGLPALRYRFNRTFKIRDRVQPGQIAVPALGNKEQLALDIAKIKAFAAVARPVMCAYVGVKGSAATSTVTVLTASVLSEYSGLLSVLLDANPAAGTASASLGYDPDATITVQNLWDRARLEESFTQILRQTGSSFHHVRPVSAKSIVQESREVPGSAYGELVLPLLGQAELLHVDTANDILTPASRAVFNATDILVFTGNHQIRRSLRKVGEAMETLRQRGLKEYVDNAVVVFSNLPPKAQLDDYRKFLSLVDDNDEIVEGGERPFNGQVLGLRHDPEIAMDRVVNLWKLRAETQRDIRAIGIAVLEQVLKRRTTPIPTVRLVNGQPVVT